jgi:hypothetical protein
MERRYSPAKSATDTVYVPQADHRSEGRIRLDFNAQNLLYE